MFGPFFAVLKANNDADPYIRHAVVHALEMYQSDWSSVYSAWKDSRDQYDTPAVRLGLVLVLRRHKNEHVAEFLRDIDPKVAVEAARAIHDERIAGAMPKLAEMADFPRQPDAIAYRALSANFKLATPDAAARIARFAARSTEPDHTRVFALKLLADWETPPRRDHITGLTTDEPPGTRLPQRPAQQATDALRPVLAGIFAGSDAVRGEATKVTAKLGITEVAPVLVGLVKDDKAPISTRVDALLALAALKDRAAGELTEFALQSSEPKLRAAGLSVKAKADPDATLKLLPALLKNEIVSVVEKQAAFVVLAGFAQSDDADKLLDEWLDAALANKAAPELLLDILDAAEVRTKAKFRVQASLKTKFEQFRSSQVKSADKLAPWSDSLAGGDTDKGRDIVLNNGAVYCQRCHKLDNQGGDVGPPLNGIAAEKGKDRRYLLESIVLPSAQIAKGYETAVLVLTDGRTVSGIVKEETKKQIRLVTPENQELVIAVADIEARRTGPSAMPDDLHKKLSRRELRDVVEFLASLKEPVKKGGQ
jgi:quinoprotein glucose dehydrogenase